MISKEHKKHSDIARPSYGLFGRNEWAVVGGQCNDIKSLADEIISELTPTYKCIYADAKHLKENEPADLSFNSNAFASYTNYINYHQFNFSKEFNPFQYRQIFNDADIVLINGNHFEAKTQVVVIDENRKASLAKRVSQLTNVELILLADNAADVFDFIKETITGYNEVPVYKLSERGKIAEFFKIKMQEATPTLNGLVLAGGKSVRMGHDKGLIKWHGKEQQYYMADLLKNVCREVCISCLAGQQIHPDYQPLPDTFTGLGPFGAILSAFREKPGVAWMVIACDLPLLDLETLQYLVQHRNISSMATSFESPYNHFPEPLVAIWEPKSYPVLLSFLSQGYDCPGKALRNMDTTILRTSTPEKLTNVNTKEEFDQLQRQLQNNIHQHHAS